MYEAANKASRERKYGGRKETILNKFLWHCESNMLQTAEVASVCANEVARVCASYRSHLRVGGYVDGADAC